MIVLSRYEGFLIYNVDPIYAANLLGHASPTTTQRIYTHVMDDKVIQINDRVDAHASGILAKANY